MLRQNGDLNTSDIRHSKKSNKHPMECDYEAQLT